MNKTQKIQSFIKQRKPCSLQGFFNFELNLTIQQIFHTFFSKHRVNDFEEDIFLPLPVRFIDKMLVILKQDTASAAWQSCFA